MKAAKSKGKATDKTVKHGLAPDQGTMVIDAVVQFLKKQEECAVAFVENGLGSSFNPLLSAEKLLKEFTKGSVKFGPLGVGCSFIFDQTDQLEKSYDSVSTIQYFKELRAQYGKYKSLVPVGAGSPKFKVKMRKAPIRYVTVSTPGYVSKTIQHCLKDGVIPDADFMDFLTRFITSSKALFSNITKYKMATKGLGIMIAAVHSQQGVLHIHFYFVCTDGNGNRIGLIGAKGKKSGGNKLKVGGIGMDGIAMRRAAKLRFEPIPQFWLNKAGSINVIKDYEWLGKKISSARAEGMFPSWDIALNDHLDESIKALGVRFPVFGKRLQLAEEEARRLNNEKAKARSELIARMTGKSAEALHGKVLDLELVKRKLQEDLAQSHGESSKLKNALYKRDVTEAEKNAELATLKTKTALLENDLEALRVAFPCADKIIEMRRDTGKFIKKWFAQSSQTQSLLQSSQAFHPDTFARRMLAHLRLDNATIAQFWAQNPGSKKKAAPPPPPSAPALKRRSDP